MRPALHLLRLRTCVRCPWIRVKQEHRLWALRFLRPRKKVRSRLALKPRLRITRRRVGSSESWADFLPRCSGDLPRAGRRGKPRLYSKLDGSLGLNWSRRLLRALFQDHGHFEKRSIGILAGSPTEFIESCALE